MSRPDFFLKFLIRIHCKLLFNHFDFRLALTENGAMFELCPYTGLANPIDSPERIQDFIMTSTNDDEIEILALTADPSASAFLKVFDYPSEYTLIILSQWNAFL